MLTMITFRKATVAMFACAFGAIFLDATPAHAATIGTPHCGGNVCAFVEDIDQAHNVIKIIMYSTAEFYGHFELQTPEHTTVNSHPNQEWPVGEEKEFEVVFAQGQYCTTGWKLLDPPDGNDYEKIGGTCWNISL